VLWRKCEFSFLGEGALELYKGGLPGLARTAALYLWLVGLTVVVVIA